MGRLSSSRRWCERARSELVVYPGVPDAIQGNNGASDRGSISPLTPLRYCLFTPELPWQSRGEWRISQGCDAMRQPGPPAPGYGNKYATSATRCRPLKPVPPVEEPSPVPPRKELTPVPPVVTNKHAVLATRSQRWEAACVEELSPAELLSLATEYWLSQPRWGLDEPRAF